VCRASYSSVNIFRSCVGGGIAAGISLGEGVVRSRLWLWLWLFCVYMRGIWEEWEVSFGEGGIVWRGR